MNIKNSQCSNYINGESPSDMDTPVLDDCNNASDIKGKIGEKLAKAIDHLPLSYELATIKCDVEVESDLDTFKVQEPNKDELIALYGECEFRRWLAELLDNPKDAEIHAPEGPLSEYFLSADGDKEHRFPWPFLRR